MEVRVGPVSAASVTAWVTYAHDVLDASADDDTVTIDPVILEAFNAYLHEWGLLAQAGDPFLWVGDVEPERLEYLAHGFARIVEHLAVVADQRGLAGAPRVSEEFYQALVVSIIDTLAQHGKAPSEFSEQLRERWPGLRRV